MKKTILALSVCALCFSGPIQADQLVLANGDLVSGNYIGGDPRSVRFMGSDGSVQSYSVSDVAFIRFGGSVATAAPQAPVAQPTRAAAPSQGVTIVSSGTTISVRMIDSIDADKTAVGELFRASIDMPVDVNGRTVIPRYADVTIQVTRVQQSGAIKGSDELALTIHDIRVDGQSYQVTTDYAEVKGKGKGRKTVRNTAIGGVGGAVVGGLLGGRKGAAIGAGAGAGTGVAVAAARGTRLRIPSESQLDFILRVPLELSSGG